MLIVMLLLFLFLILDVIATQLDSVIVTSVAKSDFLPVARHSTSRQLPIYSTAGDWNLYGLHL